MQKPIVAAAALAASIFIAGGASASPLSFSAGAIPEAKPSITEVQYRTTVTTKRVVRPNRGCVVRTVRTRTPRGVVVRKVRTCR